MRREVNVKRLVKSTLQEATALIRTPFQWRHLNLKYKSSGTL